MEMKQSWLKRKSVFKQKPIKPMKRTRLRVKGHSETAELREEIQKLVREIVIARDGGCIFRNLYDYLYGQPPCNGYRKDGKLILQADHLLPRSFSATFADPRLIVTLCKGHHGWKSVGNNLRKAQYDEIVKKILPLDRVKLWEKWEEARQSHKTYKSDWKLEIVALQKILNTYNDILKDTSMSVKNVR